MKDLISYTREKRYDKLSNLTESEHIVNTKYMVPFHEWIFK